MFEKVKNWMVEHPKMITYGFYASAVGIGIIVGRAQMRSEIDAGLNAMCLADPTFLDHLKTAGDAAKNTFTKIKNF